MKEEKSCGAVVFKRAEGKIYYLLIKHRNSGHWDFPKGNTEEGESEKETAYREVKEETGISVEFLEGFREYVNYYPRKDVYKTVVFFLGECKDDDLKLQKEEVKDSAWLKFGEAKNKLTYDTAKQLLEKANNYLLMQGL